jgi:P-type Na+/K+ transporter
VIREGIESTVRAASLVPGDVIRLGVGDIVPTDCFIAQV